METIRLQFDFDELFNNKYKNIINDKKTYSTPEYFKAYWNYRKSKGNATEELLENLVTGIVDSGINAIRQTINKQFDKKARKTIDEAVKEAIKGSATWHD